jgi:hypothetical protein
MQGASKLEPVLPKLLQVRPLCVHCHISIAATDVFSG